MKFYGVLWWLISRKFFKYFQRVMRNHMSITIWHTHKYVSFSSYFYYWRTSLCATRTLMACKGFELLSKLWICCPLNSNWESPLHLCGHYRTLNANTIPDRYPILFRKDFSVILEDKVTFSIIGLQKAFHQVPMHPDDIFKNAISTPFDLFEFTFTMFVLRNAAQKFQFFES